MLKYEAISPLPDLRRSDSKPEFEFPPTLPVPREFADLSRKNSLQDEVIDYEDIEVQIQSSNDNPSGECPALEVLLDRIGADGSRVTVYSTLFHLTQLASMETWAVDGTFKTRPALYKAASSQVFTIHGFAGGARGRKQLPMVFVLMTNRRTEDYVRVFEGLKRAMHEAGLPCRPDAFMLDFEAAVWAAIRVCFPDVTAKGCGFHLAKCIHGKWRDLGLNRLARRTDALKNFYVRSQTLRFLPENYIVRAFNELNRIAVADYPAAHEVHRFLQYLDAQWIRSEVHPPSAWSTFGLELTTNNDLEAWHVGFNRAVGPRPAFYTFLEKMYVQLGNSRIQIETGDLARRESLPTRENTLAFNALWQQFQRDEIEMGDVMDGIAARYNYLRGAVV